MGSVCAGCSVFGAGWGRAYVCHNDIVGVGDSARETSPIAQHVTCITLGVFVVRDNTRKRATIVSYSGARGQCALLIVYISRIILSRSRDCSYA